MNSLRIQVLSILIIIFASNPVNAENLRVGVAPNHWFAIPVVAHSLGWDVEEGIPLEIVRFSSPATTMQGFIANQIDILSINALAPLLINEKGIEIRYIGSLFRGDITLVGNSELVSLGLNRSVVEGIKMFAAQHNRPIRIAANPKGSSMSDIALRIWMKTNHLDTGGLIEVINAGDQAQLQQLFVTKAVDAASLFEPLVTLAIAKVGGSGILLTPEELWREQSGGVVAVTKDYLVSHRSDLVKLLRLYTRAENFIRANPVAAAKIVHSDLLQGTISYEVTLESLKKVSSRFNVDPSPLVPEIQLLAKWLSENGQLRLEPKVSTLFDVSLFDESKK